MHVSELFEVEDPVDFEAARKRKQAAKVPDNLRYAAAIDKQSPPAASPDAPLSLGDMARSIILRNLDKVFGGEQLPPEDRQQLKLILRASNMIHRMQRNTLVWDVIKLYREAHPGTSVLVHSPDATQAYVKDNPDLVKYHLIIDKKTTMFDNRNAFQLYVLQNLLGDTSSWPEEEQTKLKKAIKDLTKEDADEDEEEEKPFDPMADPEYDDLRPYTKKFMRSFEYDFDDETRPYYISAQQYENPPTLVFHSRIAPRRELKFENVRAMDAWILAHQSGIAEWARRQATKQHSDLVKIKFAERRYLGLLKRVLAGNADPETIKREAWIVDDVVDTIENKEIKETFQSLAFDIKTPRMWQFLKDYHLTWLPERIRELMP